MGRRGACWCDAEESEARVKGPRAMVHRPVQSLLFAGENCFLLISAGVWDAFLMSKTSIITSSPPPLRHHHDVILIKRVPHRFLHPYPEFFPRELACDFQPEPRDEQ